MKKLIVFMFVVFCLITFPSFSVGRYKLIFALDVVRHGDRGPVKYLPKISDGWQKNEISKITLLGKKQAEVLGKKLKAYYISEKNLLPNKLEQDIVYVRSTDFQRTKETAKSILKGMYPNSFNEIQIYSPSSDDDIMNPRRTIYRKQKSLIEKNFFHKIGNSDKSFVKAIKQQITKINNIFGTNLKKLNSIIVLGDLFKVNKIHNKGTVKPISKKDKDYIISLGDKLLLAYTKDQQMACIYSKDFIGHLLDLLSNIPKQKYFLYLAHDGNVMTISTLLGFDPKKTVSYLADLRFELFQDSDEKSMFVRTSFNGDAIKICKSSKNCPLKEFIVTLESNVKNKCLIRHCEISSEGRNCGNSVRK